MLNQIILTLSFYISFTRESHITLNREHSSPKREPAGTLNFNTSRAMSNKLLFFLSLQLQKKTCSKPSTQKWGVNQQRPKNVKAASELNNKHRLARKRGFWWRSVNGKPQAEEPPVFLKELNAGRRMPGRRLERWLSVGEHLLLRRVSCGSQHRCRAAHNQQRIQCPLLASTIPTHSYG